MKHTNQAPLLYHFNYQPIYFISLISDFIGAYLNHFIDPSGVKLIASGIIVKALLVMIDNILSRLLFLIAETLYFFGCHLR